MNTNVSLCKSHLLYRLFTLIVLFVILCPQEGLGKWGRARLRRRLWGTGQGWRQETRRQDQAQDRDHACYTLKGGNCCREEVQYKTVACG